MKKYEIKCPAKSAGHFLRIQIIILYVIVITNYHNLSSVFMNLKFNKTFLFVIKSGFGIIKSIELDSIEIIDWSFRK